MDSLPTSELRIVLLDAAGRVSGAVREWEAMWVEARIQPTGWETAELLRNGQPLPLSLRRIGGAVRVVAEWPRSGAGNYELRLRTPSVDEVRVVSVQPEKLSPAAFRLLLDDLELRLPSAVALALQKAGGLAGVELLPPERSTLAEELLRLQRAVEGTSARPGLAEILPRMARDPHQVLRKHELWVRRGQARRPHPARVAQALTRAGNLAVDLKPDRVLDTRVEHTVDVYENRLVRTFVEQVEQRLRRLARLGMRAANASVIGAAGGLSRRLGVARREATFLQEVGTLEHAPGNLTMVLLRRPAYRAALESFLEFQRSVAVRVESAALDAPLENVPFLYQRWGTLQLILVLLEAAGALGYRVESERLVRVGIGAAFLEILPDGYPAVVLRHPQTQVSVRLVPERSYRRGPGPGLRSITYEQRPDVAVEVVPPAGPTAVYLFDPKYKLDGESLETEGQGGKPKKVDLDKMHAYRDAIRDAEGLRVVRYAAILYPGAEHRYPDGIEALSAYPGQSELLRVRVHEVLSGALAPVDR